MFLKLIVVFSIFALVLSTHFFWTSNIIDKVCYSFGPKIRYRFLLIGLTVLIESIFPNSLIIILHILIILRLKRLNRKRKKNFKKRDKSLKVLTKKFVINSLVFLMLFLPLRLLNCCLNLLIVV